MKQRSFVVAILLFSFTSLFAQEAKIFSVKSGKISFQSDAPFETIRASSNDVKGLLEIEKKLFAFKVRMESFDGFNSSLQKEHFNENYIESSKFPEATFNGKIIEDVDLTKDGNYTIRAKGNFTVHGISQERIIKSDVAVKNGKINIESAFSVLLDDHNIPIPKVVKDKLSSEINVKVNCELEPR
ncbi:YceI family protein [Segetibacter koreensis]|uniref:YceI family protein n=1 Tax=Segetibacter koreensis TaxID=398037 RepID=UPI000380675C|nr:YceI family protein [Segetibacter koreensis]